MYTKSQRTEPSEFGSLGFCINLCTSKYIINSSAHNTELGSAIVQHIYYLCPLEAHCGFRVESRAPYEKRRSLDRNDS